MPPGRGERHIGSINVGFQLIQSLVDSPRPLSLRSCAKRRGCRTATRSCMTSFLEIGLERQDPATSRYDLGPLALDLGLAAMRKADVIELAKDAMYRLEADTSQSVFLSVWGNRGPTTVSKVDSPKHTALQLTVGFVLPLLETATGRVFLAYLPRGQTQGLIAAELSAGPQLYKSKLTPRTVETLVARRWPTARHLGCNATMATPASRADLRLRGSIRATVTLIGSRGAFERRRAVPRAVLRAAGAVSKLGFRARPAPPRKSGDRYCQTIIP